MNDEELAEIRYHDKAGSPGMARAHRHALLAEVDRLKKSIEVTDRGLHILVQEQHHDVAELRAEVDRLKKIAGSLASGWLDCLLNQRLDDGTPVLEVVFAEHPDLRDRLLAVLS